MCFVLFWRQDPGQGFRQRRDEMIRKGTKEPWGEVGADKGWGDVRDGEEDSVDVRWAGMTCEKLRTWKTAERIWEQLRWERMRWEKPWRVARSWAGTGCKNEELENKWKEKISAVLKRNDKAVKSNEMRIDPARKNIALHQHVKNCCCDARGACWQPMGTIFVPIYGF